MNQETYINEKGRIVSGRAATSHHITNMGLKGYIEKYHPEIVEQITEVAVREAAIEAVYEKEISIVFNLYRSISKNHGDIKFSMNEEYIFDYDLIKRVLDHFNVCYWEDGELRNPIVLGVW
ncbi:MULTISPECIES: hypothetical protein [Bacillus cereus group]|uniref:hypothetical protein n=1 Tax=Bacillus cereus group TaxID=86661 RepID=UPI0008FD97E7|nr:MULTISPECIES: hypothetical protein [Bacillus cereus group]MDG1622863.1 hypothetical protein [Bacillus mobilis]MDX5837228.1 hypothetical protein [Bacillus cereus group sp. BfR-BA-01700]OJE31269.1 hypothetical protein BAQ44_22785 [Bacillus mobilis]HDR7244381.1 hypothetical protein [Bacillus mobilis]